MAQGRGAWRRGVRGLGGPVLEGPGLEVPALEGPGPEALHQEVSDPCRGRPERRVRRGPAVGPGPVAVAEAGRGRPQGARTARSPRGVRRPGRRKSLACPGHPEAAERQAHPAPSGQGRKAPWRHGERRPEEYHRKHPASAGRPVPRNRRGRVPTQAGSAHSRPPAYPAYRARTAGEAEEAAVHPPAHPASPAHPAEEAAALPRPARHAAAQPCSSPRRRCPRRSARAAVPAPPETAYRHQHHPAPGDTRTTAHQAHPAHPIPADSRTTARAAACSPAAHRAHPAHQCHRSPAPAPSAEAGCPPTSTPSWRPAA